MKLWMLSESSEFISPDDFWDKPESITFMYDKEYGLFAEDGSKTHTDLIYDNLDIYSFDVMISELGYNPSKNSPDNFDGDDIVNLCIEYRSEVLEKRALLGRIGYKREIHCASFWNTGDIVERDMKQCLQALYSKGYITYGTSIVTQHYETNLAGYLLNGTPLEMKGYVKKRLARKEAVNKNDEIRDDKKIEDQRKLHIMQGREKREKMKEFGLSPYNKKSDWQRSAEDNKIVTPGNKWWATTSESKEI